MPKGFTVVEDRKIRVSTALGILRVCGEVELLKAVALISYNLGVSRDKAREYVDILIGAGYIKRDRKILSFVGQKEKTDEEAIDERIEAKSG